MDTYAWYAALEKPFFAPPAWVFGPVWTILYIIMAWTFGYVLYAFFRERIPFRTLLPFLLNLAFNFSFTTFQFTLQNNLLAFADILLVLVTLVWAMKRIVRRYRWVAYLNVPYLLWVSFATVLQGAITVLNW